MDEVKMKLMKPIEKIDKLLAEMRDTFVRKENDYSDGDLENIRSCSRMGISALKAVLVRMNDKWMRITNLAGGKKAMVETEKLRDTLLDLSLYGLIAIVLLEEEGGGSNVKV